METGPTTAHRRLSRHPVKAACLSCRKCKVRCDGQYPCYKCRTKAKVCCYQPSQRGGLRRKRRPEDAEDFSVFEMPANISAFEGSGASDPFLESILNLSFPQTGINNLDRLPDTMPDPDHGDMLYRQDIPGTEQASSSSPFLDDRETVPVRMYHSEAQILNAYYIFIHPFFPILPPPISPVQEDSSVAFKCLTKGTFYPQISDLAYCPASPLSMALAAVLAVIPADDDSESMSEASFAARRSVSQLLAQRALQLADGDIDLEQSSFLACRFQSTPLSCPRPLFHGCVPFQLEAVLALLVLSLYEYCQRGNLSKMRARANQAMTLSMDMDLHRLANDGTLFSEAQRRAWWMMIHVVYQSSILQNSKPHVSIDDPQITVPYPSFHVSSEPWPLYIQAQKVHLEVAHFITDLENYSSSSSIAHPLVPEQMLALDSKLRSMMSETDLSPNICRDRVEALSMRNMWLFTRSVINSARLKLHRFRAFSNQPIFLEKHCDLATVKDLAARNTTEDKAEDQGYIFPFSKVESLKVCQKSSLASVRIFHSLCFPERNNLWSDVVLVSPDETSCRSRPIPYFACCAMQTAYAVLILLYTVRNAFYSRQFIDCQDLFSDPEPGTEAHDAERLIEELQHNLERLLEMMHCCFSWFEGVGSMREEIQNAYQAAFLR
ncbi:hypothetical protein L228DRAFT_150998 [Xylona heveae TC161]|uniref:Zn(2)-C6 fungal-type domain-containing protein n=1 Tax=Xylona heveae (strain CBS 132557 / TC161) TaxID=1328760 RepID=A0A165GLM1_XYLHT|nr:hypothetical protein L228DRAFT_150998 [Xylona heveae TC161]KZF22343.1 hypothetical protein L228DRAFT_150998 [Xylona heveae TC161]